MRSLQFTEAYCPSNGEHIIILCIGDPGNSNDLFRLGYFNDRPDLIKLANKELKDSGNQPLTLKEEVFFKLSIS